MVSLSPKSVGQVRNKVCDMIGADIIVHIPGRGKLGTCKHWNGEVCCGENLAPIKYHCKFWYKFQDCGTRTSIGREWWLLFPVGIWFVALIPCSFSGQVRSGQVLPANTVRQPAIKRPMAGRLAETHTLRGPERAPAGREATWPRRGLSWGTWYGSGTSASSR